ncbi:inactive protein kinase SELMODRAFT_444075-like [Cornus florida]|uniref:inactive protein kinase SELMODRAFT_444075-like n=1 Tax=Cornus florida TaxID=4283 RepID=UPI00289A924C|nr:inactive protein kinase SELMODRAFT_444075-like [Cornus florida]
MEAQKMLVIQDASRDVSWSAIRWILDGSLLKPGDELTLLGVLHKVINPSTLSFMGAGKFLGYRSKVDSSSIFGVNPKIVEEEVARKMEKYYKNEEIVHIFEQCKMKKIKFRIELYAGNSPKVVALEAAKSLRATWVILDRQMKKDKKYFLEKLSCGISRMKRDNSIEQLRGPKNTTGNFTYDEMIPGSTEDKLSPITKYSRSQKTTLGKEQGGDVPPWDYSQKLPLVYKFSLNEQMLSTSSSSSSLGFTETASFFSTSASSSSLGYTDTSSFSISEARSSSLRIEDADYITNAEQETAGREQTEAYITGSPDEKQKEQHISDGDRKGLPKAEESFRNSVCSVCNNTRPRIELKKDFTYAELHAATQGFSKKNFLSEGGFGSVYQGELKNGVKIAVKQHKVASSQGEKEFKTEVHVLSKARHENLVMLLGSCSEGSRRLLVYEYVCNGSLDQHLSKSARSPLSWDQRIKIALGAAKGLEYLHRNNIIHRDMRPSNILITHDHEPLLGDFGLARTQYEDADRSTETRVVGTLGYLAPEYAESGKVSTKTDVYSFGVVLLQLITGLTMNDKILGDKSLVGWARPLLKEKNYPDLIDERLEFHDVHQLLWMVRVAEKCLTKDSHKRISMIWVLNYLNYIDQGNTTNDNDCMEFSPVLSDSQNSIGESPGSEDYAAAGKNEELSSSANNRNHMSRSLSPSFVLTHTLSAKSSGQSSSDVGKTYEKKRATQTSYNDMVI